VIDGITGSVLSSMTIVSCFLSLEGTEFCATTRNVNEPIVDGVPDIMPEFVFNDKPFGKLPSDRLHVMGVVPVAASVVLYNVPFLPFGSEVVVMVTGVPDVTVIVRFFPSLEKLFSATI